MTEVMAQAYETYCHDGLRSGGECEFSELWSETLNMESH